MIIKGNSVVEDAGAVEGALEVGAILKYAHLLHINPGAIREHLDRLPGRVCLVESPPDVKARLPLESNCELPRKSE